MGFRRWLAELIWPGELPGNSEHQLMGIDAEADRVVSIIWSAAPPPLDQLAEEFPSLNDVNGYFFDLYTSVAALTVLSGELAAMKSRSEYRQIMVAIQKRLRFRRGSAGASAFSNCINFLNQRMQMDASLRRNPSEDSVAQEIGRWIVTQLLDGSSAESEDELIGVLGGYAVRVGRQVARDWD